MTADGKTADFKHFAARFGSASDKTHLERQVSLVDGVVFDAATLRSYARILSLYNLTLLKERIKRLGNP